MKYNILLGALLLSLPVLTACDDNSGSEFPPKPQQDIELAPKVLSTSPQADITNAFAGDAITITYNKEIHLTPVTTISVNGQYIDEGIIADGCTLTIPCQMMPNTKYTVEIANPTVRDENYNFSPTFSFSFLTKGISILDPSEFDIDAAPVNPSATPEAQKLYRLLVDNFGSRVISGAVAQGCHDVTSANIIKQMSGKYPVINCFDFMEHIQCAPLNPGGWSKADYQNIAVDERWASEGGIVSYQWHWNVPQTEADADDFSRYAFYCNGAGSSNTDFSPERALMPDTWEHRILDRDLDVIAGYLLALQQKGIPVLWRPLHEAAGNTNTYNGGKAWFWWGNSGPEVYKQLWQYVFDRLKAKGVNNLVWVWTSCGNDADWYPGDKYVDVIGVDYYESDPMKYHLSMSEQMGFLMGVSRHKVLALSEAGALPSVEAMVEGGDLWGYAIPWNGQYTTDPAINSPQFFREFMNHELVLSRDEMTPIK